MDESGSIAVAKILEHAGVKKIRFSAATPTIIVSDRKLNAEDIAHGETFVEEFISHHGVKGMRWGVRRTDRQLRRAAKERKSDDVEERGKNTSSKSDKKTPSGKVNVKDLSDAELRARLNRMQMEMQYNALTKSKASPAVSVGKKIAGNVVKGVAEQTLKSIGSSYATKYTADYLAGGAKAFDTRRKG